MKNTMIRLKTVTLQESVADVDHHLQQILSWIDAEKDTGVVVFPELTLCGYTCADLFQQSILLTSCYEAVEKIASATKDKKGLTLVVGTPILFKDKLYNCGAVISEGMIAGFVPKSYIPTYSEFYENRWFTTGKNIKNETVVFNGKEIPFGTDLLFVSNNSDAVLGVEICEDLWVADKPSTHLCLAGANIIANLSASDETIGKQAYRRNLVSMQSASCYCAYAYVSSGTGESSTDLVFSGHTLIASNGKILKEHIYPSGMHEESALIDLEEIRYNRMHSNTFETEEADYRMLPVSIAYMNGKEDIAVDEFVNLLKEASYPIANNPFVPQDLTERKERCRQILAMQAHGLATRVRATHIYNLVIGISGGLDSTLALIVCAEAKKIVPEINIIAITMPRRGNTSSHTYENALNLMHAFADEEREIPIEEGVKHHLNEIGHGEAYQGENDTTYENAQARYRTYILMDAANQENGLVVGTGDLSELALGWCTYNGDHMSMYAVNTSVPKTLVQFIVRTYAEMADEDVAKTLISICDTPISPELTPHAKDGSIAQKTEDKIGKYDLNDFFLYYFLRYGMDPLKILSFALVAYPTVTKEEMKDALIRFMNRFFHQQFKRSCLPDGVKIGSVTLSPRGDWRMPTDASNALWIAQVKKA